MALADSGRAIGAVTRLLQDHLVRRGFQVTVGKPEDAAANDANAKLNLFLYETEFDAQLRNMSLVDGQPPALWLVLKYLLTAFDAGERSDSADAHEMLGRGLAALHEINFLRLDASVPPGDQLALENNPEPIKLTFDDSTVDLLSKIMQGTDERYRLSVAFQLRPILIIPGPDTRAALLVGIDYTSQPHAVIGEQGIALDVQPSMGARLDRVAPRRFEAGASIELFGLDLAGEEMEVVLGNVVLTVTTRRSDRLVVTVEGDLGGAPQGPIAAGTALSAGEAPLFVRRRLSATRTRSSNLLLVNLLPTLTTAAVAAGNLSLTGVLLGREDDDIMISLNRDTDGVTVRSFDSAQASANQQSLTVPGVAAAVAPGTYRVILRVNNQQARTSPLITLP